ncbi:mitochondrial ribosomal protein S15 [Hysterangium stoloniferum]|nr:mitochondrial ribosomal protein S15 [Hysterangium stoloniferum]
MSIAALLRGRIHKGLRDAIQSISSAPASSSFHTSIPAQASRRTIVARLTKKVNTSKRIERERFAANTKADPILGHRPGDEAKWLNCDLAKLLVSEKELQVAPVTRLDVDAHVKLPQHFQWGVGGSAELQHLLFDSLPSVSAQRVLRNKEVLNPNNHYLQHEMLKAQWNELRGTHMLARLVDLRNASAKGIAFENRRRCVEAFSAPGKPHDTGRTEVQAAILTMKIRNLYTHLQLKRKDIANRRSLRILVHKRAKLLKYLKRLDRERFETALGRLGLEESAIEGELIVY